MRAGLRGAPTYICMSALLILGGCSRGPSASDIQAALEAATNSLFGNLASKIAKIESVSDVDCKEAQGQPGYTCSFTVTSFDPVLKAPASRVLEARFVQNNSTWVIMSDR